MDIQNAHFFPVFIQCVGNFFANIRNGTDGNDDTVCIRGTVIVKEMIASACDGTDTVHIVLDDVGNCFIERIGRFTMLEINIRVFRRSADNGMIRMQGGRAETFKSLAVNQSCKFFIVKNLYLLYFMAGAKPVKEINERYAPLDSSQMSNSGKVHDFLYIRLCQHSAACSTGTHYVLMIAKN